MRKNGKINIWMNTGMSKNVNFSEQIRNLKITDLLEIHKNRQTRDNVENNKLKMFERNL